LRQQTTIKAAEKFPLVDGVTFSSRLWVAPERPDGWIQLAYSLRRAKGGGGVGRPAARRREISHRDSKVNFLTSANDLKYFGVFDS